MQSNKRALVVVAVVLVVGGWWLRHYFSPGEVVKRKLISTIESFEEEKLLAVMSNISRRYSDPWGFDYETFGGYVHSATDTYEGLDVDYELGEPIASEDRVQIGIEFIIYGDYEGSRGYIIGSRSEPCTAVLLWRKETPGWRLASTLELDIPEARDQLEQRRLN